jgi:RsbT co-antagonist protein rsbRD N-terminal domain
MQHIRELSLIIENNSDIMAQRWLDVVRRNSGTPAYHDWDEQELKSRACDMYRLLAELISKPTLKKRVREPYLALGRCRYAEGFALSEVIQAMIITRRVLWYKVQSEHLLEHVGDLDKVNDLYNRVLAFFDRAIYYTSKGYEQAAKELGKPVLMTKK